MARRPDDTKAVPFLKWVGGKRNFFPRRELGTLRYSIEDTYWPWPHGISSRAST